MEDCVVSPKFGCIMPLWTGSVSALLFGAKSPENITEMLKQHNHILDIFKYMLAKLKNGKSRG